MIAAENLRVNLTVEDFIVDAFADNEIVDAPADVPRSGVAQIRPERVCVGLIRIPSSIDVDEAER